MKWNNQIQEAVIKEWTEGVQKAKDPEARRTLRKRIAEKYELPVYVIQGIIELAATQGLNRIGGGEMQDGRRWEPINYHELIGNLKEEVATLKRQFAYLLEGVEKAVKAEQAKQDYDRKLLETARWMRRQNIIDLDDRPRLK